MHLDIPAGDFSAYLFDLDGTLIDSMPAHYHAWDTAMRKFGLREPLDVNLFYSLGGVPTEGVADLLGKHYGLKLDPMAVMEAKEPLYLASLGAIQIIPEVVEFARRVAVDHPVAIVTGGTPEVALPALHATGLSELFKVVITPLDVQVGRGKPAPDMFLMAARRLSVAPEKCLVFEDAEPGVQGALPAGMQVVRVPSRR